MLLLKKRKCPKCKHEFVTWTGGFILKDPPFSKIKTCPVCHSRMTKP